MRSSSEFVCISGWLSDSGMLAVSPWMVVPTFVSPCPYFSGQLPCFCLALGFFSAMSSLNWSL